MNFLNFRVKTHLPKFISDITFLNVIIDEQHIAPIQIWI